MDFESLQTQFYQSPLSAPDHAYQHLSNGYAGGFEETGKSSPPELADDMAEVDHANNPSTMSPRANIAVDGMLSRLKAAPEFKLKHHGNRIRNIKVHSIDDLPREQPVITPTSMTSACNSWTSGNPKNSTTRRVRCVHFSPRESEDGTDESFSKKLANKITQTVATHMPAPRSSSLFSIAPLCRDGRQFHDKSVNTSPVHNDDHNEQSTAIARNSTDEVFHPFQYQDPQALKSRLMDYKPRYSRDRPKSPCSCYKEAYASAKISDHQLDDVCNQNRFQKAPSNIHNRETSPLHSSEAAPISVLHNPVHPVQEKKAPNAVDCTRPPDLKKIDILQVSEPNTINIVRAPQPRSYPHSHTHSMMSQNDDRRDVLQVPPFSTTLPPTESPFDSRSWLRHRTKVDGHCSYRAGEGERHENSAQPENAVLSAPDLPRTLHRSMAEISTGSLPHRSNCQSPNNSGADEIPLSRFWSTCNGIDSLNSRVASHELASPDVTAKIVEEDGPETRKRYPWRSETNFRQKKDISVQDSRAQDITWLEFAERDVPSCNYSNLQCEASSKCSSRRVWQQKKRWKERTGLLTQPPFTHVAAQKQSAKGLGSSYWFDVPFQGKARNIELRPSETGQCSNLQRTPNFSLGRYGSPPLADNKVARSVEILSPSLNIFETNSRTSIQQSSESKIQGRPNVFSGDQKTPSTIMVDVKDADDTAAMATTPYEGATVYPGVLWPKFTLCPGDIMMTRNLRREANKVGGYVTLFPDPNYFVDNDVDEVMATTNFPGYYQLSLFDMVLRLGRIDTYGDWSWNPSSFLYLFMYTPSFAGSRNTGPSWWLVDSKPTVKLPLPDELRHETTDMPLNSRLQLSPRITDLVISTIPDPMLACKKRWRAQWWSSHYLPLTQDVLVRASFGTTPSGPRSSTTGAAAESGDTGRAAAMTTTATVELYSYSGGSVATWRFLGRDAYSYGPSRRRN